MKRQVTFRCLIDACPRRSRTLGYCELHYKQWRKFGWRGPRWSAARLAARAKPGVHDLASLHENPKLPLLPDPPMEPTAEAPEPPPAPREPEPPPVAKGPSRGLTWAQLGELADFIFGSPPGGEEGEDADRLLAERIQRLRALARRPKR